MEVIKDIFDQINAILSGILNPTLGKVTQFLSSDQYVLISSIAFLASLLVLIGLFRWLRKAPKLFLFVVVLLGIFVTTWYFLGR